MTEIDLFNSNQESGIILVDDGLDLTYWNSFIDKKEADLLLNTFLKSTPWFQPEIWMFGKRVKTPRLTAWYGDEHASYAYSGIVNEPIPWTETLKDLKNRIELITNQTYNSVLLNLYRDGNDHLSWHSDNEKDLGNEPIIASLSLGAERIFGLRTNSEHMQSKKYELLLENGSLLCMRGKSQVMWEHSIKKEKKVLEPRVNLTFRKVKGKGNLG